MAGPNKSFESVSAESGRFKGIPWHDVTAYGAVGDGATDDSQAFIDAMGTDSEFRRVFLPHPQDGYLIDQQVTVPSNTVIATPSPWTGAKVYAGQNLGGTEAVFRNTSGFENIHFFGVEVDGSNGWGSVTYGPSQKAFFFKPGASDDGTKNFSIRYCYAHDTPATAIGCDSIINQHYRNNIVENAGTDGESTGSNGIGIGLGEVSGSCPTWIVGNWIVDTAEFGIILEQTGDTLVAEGVRVNGNMVDDARVGIGVEQCRAAQISGNWIKASARMDHGILVDALDGTFGVTGATVNEAHFLAGSGGEAPDTAAFEFGSEASICSLDSYTSPSGPAWGAPVNNGSFCSIDGIGQEAAGAGNEPTWVDRWERLTVSQVRNTDDGTVWVPDQTGGWDQIV